jgi:cysteine desulfurase
MQSIAFLDHAATTPLDQRILSIALEKSSAPANPSSVHRHGQSARNRLESARELVSSILAVPPAQVVFTSSATESNNAVLRGWALCKPPEAAFFSSPLEHSCVRETAKTFSDVKQVTLGVSESGTIALPAGPIPPGSLLTLMRVQNETGVVQAADAVRNHPEREKFLWLCDATQGVGLVPLGHRELGWDFLSLSSHKIYGPGGVGLLAGPGVAKLPPLLTGGPQEGGHRAGTQPVALIEAFAEALRLAFHEASERRAHLEGLESEFLGALQTSAPNGWRINGSAERLPGFLNLSLQGIEGPDAVIALDVRGFSVSSGSACSTGVMEPSEALLAMYPGDAERASSGLRITFGQGNVLAQARGIAAAIAELLERGRRRS